MAFYFKHYSPSYDQEKGEFSILFTLMESSPNGNGQIQVRSPFDGIKLITPNPSKDSVKAVCSAFMAKLESFLSDDFAASASADIVYKSDGTIYTPPPA